MPFCHRCQIELRIAPTRKPEARMLRQSTTSEGACLDCAVTEWICNTYPLNLQIDRSPHGAQSLLLPPLQARFGQIMEAANADADVKQINWSRVVSNWHLPVQVALTATNCYLPKNAIEFSENPKRQKKRKQSYSSD